MVVTTHGVKCAQVPTLASVGITSASHVGSMKFLRRVKVDACLVHLAPIALQAWRHAIPVRLDGTAQIAKHYRVLQVPPVLQDPLPRPFVKVAPTIQFKNKGYVWNAKPVIFANTAIGHDVRRWVHTAHRAPVRQ